MLEKGIAYQNMKRQLQKLIRVFEKQEYELQKKSCQKIAEGFEKMNLLKQSLIWYEQQSTYEDKLDTFLKIGQLKAKIQGQQKSAYEAYIKAMELYPSQFVIYERMFYMCKTYNMLDKINKRIDDLIITHEEYPSDIVRMKMIINLNKVMKNKIKEMQFLSRLMKISEYYDQLRLEKAKRLIQYQCLPQAYQILEAALCYKFCKKKRQLCSLLAHISYISNLKCDAQFFLKRHFKSKKYQPFKQLVFMTIQTGYYKLFIQKDLIEVIEKYANAATIRTLLPLLYQGKYERQKCQKIVYEQLSKKNLNNECIQNIARFYAYGYSFRMSNELLQKRISFQGTPSSEMLQWWKMVGDNYYYSKDYRSAIKYYTKINNWWSTNEVYSGKLAICHYKLGYISKAKQILENCEKFYNRIYEYTDIYEQLMHALYLVGHYQKSKRIFKMWLTKDYLKHYKSFYNIGIFILMIKNQEKLTNYDTASQLFEQIYEFLEGQFYQYEILKDKLLFQYNFLKYLQRFTLLVEYCIFNQLYDKANFLIVQTEQLSKYVIEYNSDYIFVDGIEKEIKEMKRKLRQQRENNE